MKILHNSKCCELTEAMKSEQRIISQSVLRFFSPLGSPGRLQVATLQADMYHTVYEKLEPIILCWTAGSSTFLCMLVLSVSTSCGSQPQNGQSYQHVGSNMGSSERVTGCQARRHAGIDSTVSIAAHDCIIPEDCPETVEGRISTIMGLAPSCFQIASLSKVRGRCGARK